jgi:phospholipase C
LAIIGMVLAALALIVPGSAAQAKAGGTGSAIVTTPAGSATRQTVKTPIRHVVVIDMENHSFDNVLGYWCDNHPVRCPDGGMPSSVRLSNGAVVTPDVMPDTVPDVNHEVAAQLAALNIQHGVPQMNGWQNIPAQGSQNDTCSAATGYKCIGGYKPSHIPNLAALAGHFAISDMTFSMADSPSWGGHLYAAMASLDGFTGDNPVGAKGVTKGPGWGCDSDKVTPWRSPGGKLQWVPSCIPDFSLGLPNGGAFRHTPAAYHRSIFDLLHAAGLSWRIYGAAKPVAGDNGGYLWSVCPSLAECLYTSQRSHLVDHSKFVTDAAAGKLPAFSLITAGGSGQGLLKSCHNKFSMTACDNYIGSLVQAAENSPEWSSTAVFITFDDFGGFYDQVPPGVNPDGTQEGPRVPLIIVSPYARHAFTDTTASSFAGILAYTEHTFGLASLGPNDAGAYDFSNAFNYSQQPLKEVRIVTRPLPRSAKKIKLTPALLNDPS